MQALEEGEDIDELQDRMRDKKSRRGATSRLVREAGASGRGTPASDTDSRGRRGGRKVKGRMAAPDSYEPSPSKRKRGKAMSVTPSVHDDEDDDRDSVCVQRLLFMLHADHTTEASENEANGALTRSTG